MTFFLRAAALSLFLGLALSAGATPLPTQRMDVTAVPAPPFDSNEGFLAQIDNSLVAAGSKDGNMVLWITGADKAGDWRPTESAVPRQVAVARHGSSLLLIGGVDQGAPVPKVSKLELVDGAPRVTPLPDLPAAVAGAAAAVVGDKLYVLGGDKQLNPPQPTSDFWILDLKNPVGWTSGPAFPGEPRAFAASTEQYGMLGIFGGTGATGALRDTWLFRPVPIEGTNESGWKRVQDIPADLGRGTALPLGQAQVLLLGGEEMFAFHTLTHAWFAFEADTGVRSPRGTRSGSKIVIAGTDADGQPAAAELVVPRSVRNLVWIDYLVIGVYFLALSGIGFYFSRKQDTSAEFSLGNRKVKWWAAGISMFATGASAISFMAIPALAFATNLVWLFPLAAMIPAYFLTAHFIYPLLRRMEITSTYEYLERRFNRALRVIASLQAIVFQTLAKAGVVLLLPSLAISSVTGMSVYTSVLIMGIVTTIYTAIGGFDAVIWTEVLQAVLMLFAPLAIMWVCVTSLPGGMGEFLSTSVSNGKFDFALLTWDVTVPAVWVLLVMAFLNNTVVPAGDQPIVQRVFSAPLPEVRKVNLTFTVCGILIGAMTNIMGLTIFAYFRARPEMLDPMSQNDQIVPLFVTQAMPVGFAGLVIAAIFAAAMSTVASIMNSVATIYTEDFYVKFKPAATDRQRLFTLKTASYIVGMIGTAMALLLAAQDLKSMMVVWTQFTALLGGGIVGVYSLGMFTKRANGFGAICGAIGSIAITGVVKLYTTLHWGTYVPIAIFSCIIIGYLCSLVRPPKTNLLGLTVYTPSIPAA